MIATTPEEAVSEFIRVRTYARWLEEEERRETWSETVNRYLNWITDRDDVRSKLRPMILDQKVMPSMRALWSAGKAADKDNTSIYNCSFLVIDSIDCFSELLYILMCGTGVGFNCESKYVNKLPAIQRLNTDYVVVIQVEDSKEGWAKALKQALEYEFLGTMYNVDYSKLRPAGARLITFGGRSSGPEPLVKLMNYVNHMFRTKRIHKDTKLTPLDVHDLCCNIAEIVVVGGVRRSSMISLSDLNDDNLRWAKTNDEFKKHPYRAMANNSAVYYEKPSSYEFKTEWDNLASSGTGERGIFNYSGALQRVRESRRNNHEYFITADPNFGTNPCGEILLRDKQFCNLSEVILRENDNLETFLQKVQYATILGTLQASKTYFPFLRKEWQEHCEEEQLLGVSITGQFDNIDLLKTPGVLEAAKQRALETSLVWSQILGNNVSAAITCVKPSGTVSQLTNASSGAHPRYAHHYFRRYRISANDPLFFLMKDCGFDFSPENGQTEQNATTWVCTFPVKAPEKSKTRHEVSASDQIDHYLMMQEKWTEHNTSMTVYVKDDEWEDVGKKVYDNFDKLIALAFLPEEHIYDQAPYEEITEDQYKAAAYELPLINYKALSHYEKIDQTTGEFSYACVGNSCEL